jgi:Zn-dependent protease
MFNRSITEMLLSVPGILLGLVLHEFAHALMADKLGDRTPRYQGRLTLSPISHLDPIGFILIMVVGFGWAKPVQIDPRNLRHPRRDDALISLAGPAANFILAVFFGIILKVLIVTNISNSLTPSIWFNLEGIIKYSIYFNILLGVFNLLPIPPLDGSHILEDLTDVGRFQFYQMLKQYSTIILILIIATPIAGRIISPPIIFFYTNLFRVLNI